MCPTFRMRADRFRERPPAGMDGLRHRAGFKDTACLSGRKFAMLDELYAAAVPWAKANKTQIVRNRVLGVIANLVYPLYCGISRTPEQETDPDRKENVVISLTSYPARIRRVHLCIESLLRQKYKANDIVLWLSRQQFPHELDDLPHSLVKLTGRGVRICFVEHDDRSYKKIIYTGSRYPGSVVITADDDTLYPENWLEKLMAAHRNNPDCIVCYRAHYITMSCNRVRKYNEWKGLAPDMTGPDIRLVAIGVGGILYPVNFLEKEIYNMDLAKKLCPTSDDLWLKAMEIIHGFAVVKVEPNSREWFTIKGSQHTKLFQHNAGADAANDTAWRNLDRQFSLSDRIIAYEKAAKEGYEGSDNQKT